MSTILVVDDEIGIRDLLREILMDEGHTVLTAENAKQAKEIRLSENLDLVLLDIWMPDTDGITLLKEWQAEGQLTMPVIMMSGHATIDTAVEATRIGAINFLEKPITMNKLLQAVQQGLVRRSDRYKKPIPNNQPVAASKPETIAPTPAPVEEVETKPDFSKLSFEIPLREARDLFERVYFEYHIANEKGSMTRIAEKAGLERTHLYRKLKQLNIVPEKTHKKH